MDAPASQRNWGDLYTTDSRLVDLLFERFDLRGTIVEPCAGPGRMARAIEHHAGPIVTTNDIDPAFGTDFCGDASDPGAEVWGRRYSHTITNPPFNLAEEILPVAWNHTEHVMAVLLRITYQEPTKGRGQWLEEMADHLVSQIIVNPRPKFREGEINPKTGKEYGTDSTTVAWLVWSRQHSWKALGLESPFQYARDWNG